MIYIIQTKLIVQVEIIYLSGDYNGKFGLFANDIAVIVLAEKMSFSNGVAPVCIDWKNMYKVENENTGMVNMLYCIICSFIKHIKII